MKKMPRGIRKYIRKEKSRIRREFLGRQEQEQKVQELLEKFHYGVDRVK